MTETSRSPYRANAERELADLRRRVDRTTAYLWELLDGPLDTQMRVVLEAALKSLTTPVAPHRLVDR